MRIIRNLDRIPPDAKGSVLALGNFDGIHRGHQAILSHAADIARAKGKKPAAMIFEPHPREFFSPSREKLRLYPLAQKLALLREQGIEILFLMRFNKPFAGTTAESFIHDILHRRLAVSHVVTGYDFAFGKGRAGTTEMLAEAGHRLGFGFTALPAVSDAGGVISSSAIRAALREGDVTRAAQMLGRDYEIEGRVARGQQRGRMLGFPTANISPGKLFLPKFGVYAAQMAWEDETWHDAVANLGVKPTFGANAPVLEAHGFGQNHDLYGKKIRVRLRAFIREERAFAGADALKAQIAQDCERAKQLLETIR